MKRMMTILILVTAVLALPGCQAAEPAAPTATATSVPTATETPLPTRTPTPTSTATQEWCSQKDLDEYWDILMPIDNLVVAARVDLYELLTENLEGDYWAKLQEIKFWEIEELLQDSSPPPCLQEFLDTYLDAVEQYGETALAMSSRLGGNPDVTDAHILDPYKQATIFYQQATELLFEIYDLP